MSFSHNLFSDIAVGDHHKLTIRVSVRGYAQSPEFIPAATIGEVCMSYQKPLIGVTPWYDYDRRTTYIKPGYLEGINEAGGSAVLLPLVESTELLEYYMELCSGFLLSGGPDIDPVYYGEVNLPCNGTVSPGRDRMEVYIARKAIEGKKPILGICRGVQVMNVAMGGTLYQDIPSQICCKGTIKHEQEAPKWYPTHEIMIEEGSAVYACFGRSTVRVNSFHHQAVKDVAPGFKITSQAVDHVIEALEYQAHPFAVGVQWHPELMWEKDRSFLKLFEALILACG